MSCKCNPSHVWVYGQCRAVITCSPNEYWTGISCQCKYGYIRIGSTCQDTNKHYYCPDNSFFNGISCQCLSGYYASGGVCLQCPFGQYWSGQACAMPNICIFGYIWHNDIKMCIPIRYSCGENEYWDGCNCRCKPGYFWINSKCQSCPQGTFYDGRQCTQGQVSQGCDGPYQFWNGYACVCIPGFFQIDQYCVTCPNLTVWNGYYCAPQAGLTRAVSPSEDNSDSNTVAAQFR